MRVTTLPSVACVSVAAGFLSTQPALAQDAALVGTNRAFYVRIDPNNGRASPRSGLGLRGFGQVEALAFDPDTGTLYGVDMFSDQLITINTGTAEGTAVGPLGFNSVAGLAFDPNNDTLYATDAFSWQLIKIDPTTGRGTAVGPLAFPDIEGLAFDPDTNTLYGADLLTAQLIAIDPATAQETVVGALTFADIHGLAFDPDRDMLYGTHVETAQLIAIDPASGEGMVVDSLDSFWAASLALDPDADIFYATDAWSDQLITLPAPSCSDGANNGDRWCDGFENYDLGTIGGKFWEPWGGNPDVLGIVTDEQNHTFAGSQSLRIAGDDDTVRTFTGYNPLTSALWDLRAWVYIPSTMTGDAEFLLNPDYEDGGGGGTTWAVGLIMNTAAGTIRALEGFPAAGELPLVTDQWAEIECQIDFDSDLVTIYYNDTFLAAGAWTVGGGGSLNIGAIDLFSVATSGFYYDDLSLYPLETPSPATPVGPVGFDWVESVAFDPNTNTLYGVDTTSGLLITIDTTTGKGTTIGPVGPFWGRGLAFDPNTNTLYGSDAGQLFTIDTATGQGTAVGDFGFNLVLSLAFDPNTNTLYGADYETDQLITINTTTGAGAAVGLLGFDQVEGLAFDPNTNTLYGADWDTRQLITISTISGNGTPVAELAWAEMSSLTFDRNTNTLYGAERNADQITTIDTTTAQVTPVGALGFQDVQGLAYNSGNNTLYGSDNGMLITINPTTGQATSVGDTGSEFVWGLAFDPNTATLYGSDGDQLITINPATGQGTAVGLLGFTSVEGLAFDPNTNTLYGTTTVAFGQLITINTGTGAGTAVGPLGSNDIRGLHFDAAANTLYGTDALTGQLVTINTSTGQGTAVGPTLLTQLVGLAGFPDCNHNGVPDAQDIIDGTSQDIDTDGIPDECVDWTGNAGDDLWGTAANWDPQVVPNNAGNLRFTATIDGDTSAVDLNIDATIDHLDLLDHATLNVNGGELTIAADTSITSEGIITISDSRGINSTGRMVMNDLCPPAGPSPAGCLPPRLSMSESGFLNGTMLTLNGGASVDMQGTTDTHIYLTGQLELDRGGTYRADPERSADTAASLHAASVLITSDGASAGAMVLEDSMSADIDGDCRLESDCPAFAADSLGCLPPRLEVYENATLTIGGSLVLHGLVIVNMGGMVTTTAPRSMSAPQRSPTPHTMTLSFNFVHYLTSPMSFDWSQASVLMNGAFQYFEVAGVDLGPTDSGFQDNFEIGSIEIQSDTAVTFADRIVNTGGAEVQYVDELILGTGSTLILDGTVLYFHSLVAQSVTITRLNGGRLSGTTCAASADCNDRDACTFDQCSAGHCAYEPNLYGDIDRNTVTNVFDIFCILDLIAGEPPDSPNCTPITADIEPCEGNAVLNVFDMIAVLGVIAGTDPCCGG